MGDDGLLSEHGLTQLEGVERVMPVLKPYRLALREFSVGDTASRLGDPADTVIGGREVVVMAGPCSVEGPDMMRETARAV